jgi:multiple sugar transport system permease protein
MANGARPRRLRLSEGRVALLLVLPTLAILIGLGLYPIGWTIVTSFRVENLFNPNVSRWVGPRNFEFLFLNDETFWKTVRLAGIWCAITVTVQLIIGFFLAMLLDTAMRGIGILRTLIIIPVFITPVALGLTWRSMFEPVGGVLNYLIRGVGLERSPWHTDPSTALMSVMIVDIWQWAPFVTLILLAGMQGISREVVEAARVDRVRGLAYVHRIVLPLIWPVVTIVLLLRVVDEIRIFDIIWTITRGGPGSATLLASVNIYSIFHGGRLGIMAAYGVLMIIAINVVVFGFLRILHRQEKATRQKASA